MSLGIVPPEYQAYHDLEWGRPVGDDARIFEKLCLEEFQSGLSWDFPRYWGVQAA
jgi:3-methyladenine DNA glycosylase Tag